MKKITNPSDTVLIDPNEPLILPDGTALVGRIEWFLYALCCLDYQNLPTPMSRIEEFANALITGEIPNIEPQSRAEQFFLAILDGNVSDLPQPQSRSEVLLDKLARGEFDLSDVEPIQSRYELLLAYLIKNGGIGNIDYVLYEFSEAMKTMYNTVEKPFKSLELSGNTLVNCVLEDTENDDYTSFDKDYSGTSFTINGTSEGAIKSAILSGQTLVNYFNPNTISELPDEGFLLNKPDFSKQRVFNYIPLIPYEENTEYTMIVWLKDVVNPNNVALNISFGFTDLLINNFKNGINIAKGTTKTISGNPNIRIADLDVKNGAGATLIGAVILKGDYTTISLNSPFYGMQSVKLPVLTTSGVNVFFEDNTMEYGAWASNGIAVSTTSEIRCKNKHTPFPKGLKNGDKMYIVLSDTSINSDTNMHVYDENKSYLSLSNRGCTVSDFVNGVAVVSINDIAKCSYFSFRAKSSNINCEFALMINDCVPYEPFKTNILTVNEDVELRGIGDVQDELDLLTGKLIKRTGAFTLNGSELFTWHGLRGTTYGFNISKAEIQKKLGETTSLREAYGICNLLQSLGNTCHNKDIEGFAINNDSSAHLQINISVDKLTESSENGIRQYLQDNAPTFVVALGQETVKTVDLNVVDQNNTKIDKIHVFDEVTHVNASSDELTPTVNIGKSVSYPTIIKPNTKYTVDLKRNDKPLTVNLGGTEVTFVDGETRKTITTPSTLTNDKLSYYVVGAKCNEIMLIEGEIEGNVDYFTGMQSVVMQNQMPILHTVGKNLINPSEFISNMTVYNINVARDGDCFTFNGESSGAYDVYITVQRNEFGQGILLRKNKTYCIGYEVLSGSATGSMVLAFKCVNSSNSVTWKETSGEYLTYTPKEDIYVSWLRMHGYSSANYDNFKIRVYIEEATSPTSYESYKTSILSCNDDVTLRGIGEVQDTLNCLTGEVVERIGEIVLDGTQDMISDGNGVYIQVDDVKRFLDYTGKIACDKLPVMPTYGHLPRVENGISGYTNANAHLGKNWLYVKINNSINKDEVKEWLTQNPVTVQYQRVAESIKTVALNVVDQDGNTIPKVKSYNNVTHLEVTIPKQSLLPNISAEVATDNSKDMSSLTVKHQEISEAQSTIEDNIQSQSDEIDTALMATTEIFESILE